MSFFHSGIPTHLRNNFIFVITILFLAAACDDNTANTPSCGDGVCDSSETHANCSEDCAAVCGDNHCDIPDETTGNCPEDCTGPVECTVLTDLSQYIGTDELYFGYPTLGINSSPVSCSEETDKTMLYFSLTPDFTGTLVISTANPSTTARTSLELRKGSCDASGVACITPDVDSDFTTLSAEVVENEQYTLVVETPYEDTDAVFALSLHFEGTCDDGMAPENISNALLSGVQFPIDTASGISSVAGSCGGGDNAETRRYFTAPKSGTMVFTSVHPDTSFETVLYIDEEWRNGEFCGSPEIEMECINNGTSPNSNLEVDVIEGKSYNLFIDGNGTPGYGTATLTMGYASQSPFSTSLLGCSHTTIKDKFAFFAESGDTVDVSADTVDANTAADLRLMVRYPDGSELHEADDDMDCTYPPPQYSCPSTTFTATVTGYYIVDIYVGTSEACADHSLVNYELSVVNNSQEVQLIQFGDD